MRPTSVRDILSQTYASRRARNGAYSLRAFARDIKLSPSRLCEVLKPGNRLSRESAERIGQRLGLSKTELERFCDLADLDHPTPAVRKGAEARLKGQDKKDAKSWVTLRDEEIALTSWSHLAILELLDLGGEPPTPDEVSDRLALSVNEVTSALETLRRMKLVKLSRGVLTKTKKNLASTFDLPSASVKRLHEELMAKAVRALHEQAFPRRSFDSLVLAMASEKIPEAKARIREFIRELNQELGSGPGKDEVYCISVQMHSLTREKLK